ncbi:MAG: HAD family hydrolase [Prevotella sp.]|nr:HAD family hydrolase [Prevotella sp.]MCM1074628.1 HAD family hydrolase [Ruminococcus sp.]
MKKLVIFDLDGTLLNTINDLGLSCNYALESNGFKSHPLSAYPYMVGNGVRRLIERAQPDASPECVDAMVKSFKQYYDEHCCDTTEPYKGIPELLKDLTDKDINIAVTSNKYEAAVKKIVSHYFPEIPFTAVLGQVEGRPIKPDPSIVFEALLITPTPKADVLYVGDSAVDIETARRALVENVGVTWGFSPVSHLRSAFADHIVSTPGEILKIALK